RVRRSPRSTTPSFARLQNYSLAHDIALVALIIQFNVEWFKQLPCVPRRRHNAHSTAWNFS
ncbi:MAG: hypothetical protein ACRD5Z_18470, partial [Bryobacteraceae bacterium]